MSKAYEALKAEAQGLSLSLDYEGEIYPLGQLDEELAEHWMYGRYVKAARLMFPGQWNEIKRRFPKTDALKRLVEAGISALGVDSEHLVLVMTLLDDDKGFWALEADLIEQNIDISDFARGEISLRKLCAIVGTLPNGSRSMKHVGGKPAQWDLKEYMLADIVDLLNNQVQATYVNAYVNGLQKQPKQPKPIYIRPVEPQKEEIVFSPTSSLSSMIRGMRV